MLALCYKEHMKRSWCPNWYALCGSNKDPCLSYQKELALRLYSGSFIMQHRWYSAMRTSLAISVP